MRPHVAFVLLSLGCGGAERAAPSTASAVAPQVAAAPAPHGGLRRPHAPAALQHLGVVQHDSDGQRACGVAPGGAVYCLDANEEVVPVDDGPALAVEVGHGCGDPICVIEDNHNARCNVTNERHWNPRGVAMELTDVRAISLYGCFGCAVSLDGHLACFGGRTDHALFVHPPQLVYAMQHAIDVEVDAARVCVALEDGRVFCAAL